MTSPIVLSKIYAIQTCKHYEMQFYYFSILILPTHREIYIICGYR